MGDRIAAACGGDHLDAAQQGIACPFCSSDRSPAGNPRQATPDVMGFRGLRVAGKARRGTLAAFDMVCGSDQPHCHQQDAAIDSGTNSSRLVDLLAVTYLMKETPEDSGAVAEIPGYEA